MEKCSLHDAQKTNYPTKNDELGRDKVKFTKTEYQLAFPFPSYFVADFECILKKHVTCLPSPANTTEGEEKLGNKSNTTILQTHSPCEAAYAVQSTDPRFYREPVIITPDNNGKSVAERFLDAIIQDAEELRKMLTYKVEMDKR